MRYLLLLLFIWLLGCTPSTTETITDPEGQMIKEADILVFGYRGGWGSETYFRLLDGKWYRNTYAGLRTNEPENKLNRDALATDEGNWQLIGPAPREVMDLARELPLRALEKIKERMDCPALAYDGGCPYLGVYRANQLLEWHGDFDQLPAVAAFMDKVGEVVRNSSQN